MVRGIEKFVVKMEYGILYNRKRTNCNLEKSVLRGIVGGLKEWHIATSHTSVNNVSIFICT